jgi:hypothetical protein
MSGAGGGSRAFVIRATDGGEPFLAPQPPLPGAAVGHLKDALARSYPARFSRKLMRVSAGTWRLGATGVRIPVLWGAAHGGVQCCSARPARSGRRLRCALS